MVTVEVAVTVAQPDEAGIVYVTAYVPAVLVFGVIAPDVVFIERPEGVTE